MSDGKHSETERNLLCLIAMSANDSHVHIGFKMASCAPKQMRTVTTQSHSKKQGINKAFYLVHNALSAEIMVLKSNRLPGSSGFGKQDLKNPDCGEIHTKGSWPVFTYSISGDKS